MVLFVELVTVYVCLVALSSCFKASDQATFRSPKCKAAPGSAGWPSEQAWNYLNASISGKLLKPLPPGAVCDYSLDVFNLKSCWVATVNYTQSAFHTSDPVSVQQPNWEHDACLPTLFHSCNTKQFPLYVINATGAHDVQEGVKFAKKYDIRLIVKGTGHDYLGSSPCNISTAPNSLSIWTHHIRGLRYHDTFQPRASKAVYANALTIAAGHQMRDIYARAAQHGRIIVGGMDPNVGIGGYITGGGHSPISGQYGLAADQVLEMELITPSGELVTSNEDLNKDLFWAMRGGGGGTFGVLLSVTVKTFPMPSIGLSILQFNQTVASTSDFWSAVAVVHTKLPALASAGLMGYYFIMPYEHPILKKSRLSFWWITGILNCSEAALDKTLEPLMTTLYDTAGLSVSLRTFNAPNYYDWWSTNIPPGTVGTNVLLGSRLVDAVALSQNVSFIASKLEQSFNGFTLLGHLVGGPGVANAQPAGGLGSMTPAWRRTITHLVVPMIWLPYDDRAEAAAAEKLKTQYVASLRDLAPETGCYLNEADVNEKKLAEAFWGQNYGRLLEIKRRYDPDGVFYCNSCVGAEDMVTTDDQNLCRR